MSKKNEWGRTPASQIRAVMKYNREHTTTFTLRLNTKTDADIIQWLQQQQNKAGSIKRLIREDIEREQATTEE